MLDAVPAVPVALAPGAELCIDSYGVRFRFTPVDHRVRSLRTRVLVEDA